MLTIIVPGKELYDEATNKFSNEEAFVLHLEHSLLSLSKWESKYLKPFLGSNEKTTEEILGYIHCMILDELVPSDLFERLSKDNVDSINNYIESKESATTFGEMPKKRTGIGPTITSELIYAWMVAYNIPFHPAETWHLNRLFSLIRICNTMNEPPKKMTRHELAQRNKELNEQRKAQLGTRG